MKILVIGSGGREHALRGGKRPFTNGGEALKLPAARHVVEGTHFVRRPAVDAAVFVANQRVLSVWARNQRA